MLSPDPRALVLYPSYDLYKIKLKEVLFQQDVLPDVIQQELSKLNDLLEVCYFKYDLLELAQLYAVMVFEKSMRIRLEREYKNISKIKLSVLIDRAKQLFLIDTEEAIRLRSLKDFRNKGAHEPSESIDVAMVIENIETLNKTLYKLFATTPTQE